MRKPATIISILVIAVFAYWVFAVRDFKLTPSAITTFEECVSRGFPVMESYPRQCRTDSGKTFTEDIGNALEKNDLVRVTTPAPNSAVKSPLIVQGEARGYWFFEASFPVKILDGNGTTLGVGIAQANPPAHGDWMTENFVPFSTTLVFNIPATKHGTLVLEKDNPSGLPEHGDKLHFPVVFE